ncbi:WhiB family transcriptional regulator [Streptomyces violascens]|uniref:WhiB family transcriptional regulator n=1 Tax=Streptomyces violascens TaxID=67381 RepID=UPI00167205EB|nr:WhiB family transcriptional regulator [Streptomyces violascens]
MPHPGSTAEGRCRPLPYWEQKASCRGTDPELFYPEGPLSNALIQQADEARSVCAPCPVRGQCLDAAQVAERGLAASERSGIRGGLDGHERYALARGRRLPKRPQPIPDDGQEHGVRRTYRKGCRCFACTAAETGKRPNPRPTAMCATASTGRGRSAQCRKPASTVGPNALGSPAGDPPECGTRSGFQWHVSKGQVPCEACTAADLAVTWLLRPGGSTASPATP